MISIISLVMHISLSTDITSEQLRMAVLPAAGNIALNVVPGLIAAVIGLIFARLIVGGNYK